MLIRSFNTSSPAAAPNMDANSDRHGGVGHITGCLGPLLLLATLTLGGGCNVISGAPTTSPKEAENNLFTGDTGAADDAGGVDAGTLACDCLKEGDWYRFTKLKIESLDGEQHNVMIVLNPLWKQDVKNLELNFYFQIVKVSTSEVTMNVVNGARVSGTKDQTCLLPYTSAQLIYPRTGCQLQDSAPSSMNVYAGTEINRKNCAPKNAVPHAIEVSEAVLSADFSADCSAIINGKIISGSLGQAALERTCTCVNPGKLAEECGLLDSTFKGNSCDGCNNKYQNLKTLLENFGPLGWKCAVDGKPAVCLVASFEAKRIDHAPAICKGL